MANRHILHKSKLEDFKVFLIRKGFEIQQLKGCYEVLRAKRKKPKRTVIVFQKDSAKEYLSLMDKDIPLVLEFIRQGDNLK